MARPAGIPGGPRRFPSSTASPEHALPGSSVSPEVALRGEDRMSVASEIQRESRGAARERAASEAEQERGLAGLLDAEYAWRAMQSLVSLGQHKIAGTEREHAAADWIEREMRRLGLADVRQEPFPVAVRDVSAGASLEVLDSAETFAGLAMAGSWPTPDEGIEAELVYVGHGEVSDFEPDLDVRGKIVLQQRRWPDMKGEDGFLRTFPALEAWSRGAVAVVTFDDLAPPDSIRLQTYHLGARDYQVRIPIVSLPAQAAERLIARIERGEPPRVRLRSAIEQRDGVSHNVVGILPGTLEPDEYVIVASHYDTWFSGAADSLAGIGAILGIARAFCASGVRPERSIVFVAHGAEEQGATQWLDWLAGSSAFINLEHPDWVGRTIAELNVDVICSDPRSAHIECAPELEEFLRELAREVSPARPPRVQRPAGLMTYVDAAAYLLAGVPSANVTFWPDDFWRYYHTPYDTVALVSDAAIAWTMRLWALAALRLARRDCDALRLDAALDFAARGAVMAAVEGAESRGPSDAAREAGEQLRAAATTAEVVQALIQRLATRGGRSAEPALREARRTLLHCLSRLSRETRVVGGPLGLHMYQALSLYSEEAAHLRHASRHLERGSSAEEPLAATSSVRGAGRFLSPAAHQTFQELIGDGGEWAPNLQRYVDVAPEWRALRRGEAPAEVLRRLRPKLARAQAEVDAAAARATRVAEMCSERLRVTVERLAAAMR